MDLTLPSSLEDHESTSLGPTLQFNHVLERPAVKAGDMCVGCIVWLPARNSDRKGVKCCRKDCCSNAELEDSGYDHPVVVIKIRQRKNSTVRGDLICYVALVTTFSDTALQTYLARRPRLSDFQQSMPINHSERESMDHPVENTPSFLLRLQKGSLRKQSYVQLKHIYKLPAHQLRTYGFRNCRAYKIRIVPTSYTLLMENLGLRNEPYEDETTLYDTAKIRLEALARTGTPREDRIRESHAYFSLPVSPGPQTCPTTPADRALATRNTMSYISIPGGGRSRSSSKASIKASNLCRNAVLMSLNYGSINTNIPTSTPLANSNLGTGGSIGEMVLRLPTEHANTNGQQSAPPTSRLLSPTRLSPSYLPPPTPHTAHYHSFKQFKDNDWKWIIGKVLAVLLVVSGIVFLWTSWTL